MWIVNEDGVIIFLFLAEEIYEFGHFLLFLAELFITLRGNKKG